MLQIFTKIADIITYQWLNIAKETPLANSIHFFIEDTFKLFFLIFSLMFIIGFFRSWISGEKVRDYLEGKPKYISYFLAAGLGAITPFCSCSSIPLFIAFLSSGIPLGVTMAFLITSPMVNEVAVILFGEAIGWTFTISYVSAGIFVGVIGGFIIDKLKLEKWIESFVFDIEFNKNTLQEIKPSFKKRINQSLFEAIDMIKKVWLYILIGIGLGAIIHGYVPQKWFLEYGSADNLFAVPTLVFAAIPLYSNVSGVIPIAEVLISKGLPVGTTLAFIMSTVAISLPELIILRKVLKPKMIAFFVIYMMIAFTIVGYSFNILF